jgi:uncharacterized membrane protein YdjX (TVP38/TMEM64 family)
VLPQTRRRVLRLLAAAGVVALVLTLIFSGVLDEFSLEKTAQWVRSFGTWGFVVFLLAFTFIQPIGVSGHTFVLAAALVWPPQLAFVLSLVGALGSSLVNVAFARWVAFDWVQARIPERLRKYERWLTERGLWGVIVFRLLTFTMHPAQLLMGVMRVPLPRLILGTLIGFAPIVAVDVWFGGELLRRLLAWLGLD